MLKQEFCKDRREFLKQSALGSFALIGVHKALFPGRAHPGINAASVSFSTTDVKSSGTEKVSPNKRNLKDDQIKALAAKKGVTGINAFPGFVKWENPTLDDLLNHVDHIANLVGTDHIGIGFDYSQATRQSYEQWGYDPETYPPPMDVPKRHRKHR